MKAVFILPNLGAGGAERVTTILSKAFVNRGVAVDIVMLLSDKVSYQVCPQVGLVALNTAKLPTKKRIGALRAYLKEQRKNHSRVVAIPFHDSCLKYALAAAVGLGVRVIACERNDPYQKGSSGIARFRANLPYALADRCVFQTPDARAYYTAVPDRKAAVIYNPLELGDGLQWQGHNSRRILSVGRLEPQKNQKLLIDAFAAVHRQFPDYTLEIYGEGSLREQLQAQIRENGLQEHVLLCGYAPDIHQKLTQTAMFVLSSDYEGMSNALMEALAIGVPVVSTDHPIGGAGMLMENGVSGILTPVGDEAALAAAMVRILGDAEVAHRLSVNGAKVREKLAVDAIAQRWLQWIDF